MPKSNLVATVATILTIHSLSLSLQVNAKDRLDDIPEVAQNSVLSPQAEHRPIQSPNARSSKLRNSPPSTEESPGDPELEAELSELIALRGLTPVDLSPRELPSIHDPLPQLGKKLFFSKSLGGEFDAACVTCHHPALGGADSLSLPVGVEAEQITLLGPGREPTSGLPVVPRNTPTVFNTGLWDTGLFWDSRVESIGKEPNTNGAISGIATPDSGFNVIDPEAGANLAAAQARFPVTEVDEMKTDNFEPGSTNQEIRDHLASRIGGYGIGSDELSRNGWLKEFQRAYGVTASAEELITFDAISHAIGEYERSMAFVNSPWQRYLEGSQNALSDHQKRGAILFFTRVSDGGAGCGACHNGPTFSDGRHHTVAFPQFGPGKGDGVNDDFGRERVTGDSDDRYRYRTPSLLNVALTAPYGHAGTYQTLEQVVRHYISPEAAINQIFSQSPCPIEQFSDYADCNLPYPDALGNSMQAVAKLRAEQAQGTSRLSNPGLNQEQVNDLVAFLHGLTDDCAKDRRCLRPWVANPKRDNPDGEVLIGVDQNGRRL
ncbi:cytochrome-c peroxidase [Hahella ganghwensis]|uniref:cytochrome-c peroxidase n=1 Tax=Hahella ganghwensis TaxID=286420 RepID=UPI0012FAD33D|nr:cytochrome c peroxidase [Hahella ganghwensis]